MLIMKRAVYWVVPFVWMASPAHAQLGGLLGVGGGAPVVCTNCETLPHSILNDALIAAQWISQLDKMVAQLQQQTNIFHSLSGLTNINAMVPVLNQAGNWNQMGTFGNIPLQLQGGAGIGAAYQAANGNAMPVGSLMPLMATSAAVFNQRAGSVATVQAVSAELLNNSNIILAGLKALQGLVDHQPTTQQMVGIQSRIDTYQGNINSQQYQLSQMQSFANAQDKVFDQKMQMANYCSAQAWANSTHPLTGAGINLGAAHCPVGAAGVVGVPVAGIAGGGGAVTAGVAGTGTAIIGAGGVVTGFTDTAGFDTAPAAAAPPAADPNLANVVGGDGQESNLAGPTTNIPATNLAGITGADPAAAPATTDPAAAGGFTAAPVPDGETGAQAPVMQPAPPDPTVDLPVPFNPTTNDPNSDFVDFTAPNVG